MIGQGIKSHLGNRLGSWYQWGPPTGDFYLKNTAAIERPADDKKVRATAKGVTVEVPLRIYLLRRQTLEPSDDHPDKWQVFAFDPLAAVVSVECIVEFDSTFEGGQVPMRSSKTTNWEIDDDWIRPAGREIVLGGKATNKTTNGTIANRHSFD